MSYFSFVAACHIIYFYGANVDVNVNQSRNSVGEYWIRRQRTVKEMGFQLFKKEVVERSETGEYNVGEGVA